MKYAGLLTIMDCANVVVGFLDDGGQLAGHILEIRGEHGCMYP
jgi:hypothetical protein